MKVIDGSKGEGGGSILRMASSLALVSQEPVKITNIRKKRPKPGLSTQHLMGLHALAQFCGGELEGAQLGSESVIFRPSNDWISNLKIHSDDLLEQMQDFQDIEKNHQQGLFKENSLFDLTQADTIKDDEDEISDLD